MRTTFKARAVQAAARVICMPVDYEGETPGGNLGVSEHHCPSCEIHLQGKWGRGGKLLYYS